ncbi:MAG: hypothetical protein ACK4S4_03945 [Pyrinomonadaceae bacterium]
MRQKMQTRRTRISSVALLAASLIASACGANESILRSNSQSDRPAASGSVEPVRTSFEKELEGMRTADFDLIFVLRRRDGAKMDADDRAAIRTATAEVNRRNLADDDKAVIIGSNYPISPENMKLLTDRFAVENFSKPEAEQKLREAAANQNSNSLTPDNGRR